MSTAGMTLVHCPDPYFARWGSVIFTKWRYLLVRLKDGALPTEFDYGKGVIHDFKTLESALEFDQNNRHKGRGGLKGKACIVFLWQKHFSTNSPRKNSIFVEDLVESDKIGMKFYHYGPPKQKLAEFKKIKKFQHKIHKGVSTNNSQPQEVVEERPSYPKRKACKCTMGGGGEPEWEWQFENVWSCLGCGQTIEVVSSRTKVLY